MHINKAVFWLAEWLEMISDGMCYLSTSPHCNKQDVSNALLQKSQGWMGFFSQLPCVQNSSLSTLQLFSMTEVKTCLHFSSITGGNIKHHVSQGEFKCLHVQIQQNQTKKKISKHFESCSIKHTQASKWKLWPLQKGQRESWEPMQCCN